jgi:hypothetical protein
VKENEREKWCSCTAWAQPGRRSHTATRTTSHTANRSPTSTIMHAHAGRTSAPSGLPARTARERAHAAAAAGAPAPPAQELAGELPTFKDFTCWEDVWKTPYYQRLATEIDVEPDWKAIHIDDLFNTSFHAGSQRPSAKCVLLPTGKMRCKSTCRRKRLEHKALYDEYMTQQGASDTTESGLPAPLPFTTQSGLPAPLPFPSTAMSNKRDLAARKRSRTAAQQAAAQQTAAKTVYLSKYKAAAANSWKAQNKLMVLDHVSTALEQHDIVRLAAAHHCCSLLPAAHRHYSQQILYGCAT